VTGESDPRLVELVTKRLTKVGLRATRPRVALGKLLFGGAHRHINAEQLYREAQSLRYKTSLATVYNTLNQFTQASGRGSSHLLRYAHGTAFSLSERSDR
jgi:Fur family iron response transcriptional regulator